MYPEFVLGRRLYPDPSCEERRKYPGPVIFTPFPQCKKDVLQAWDPHRCARGEFFTLFLHPLKK